MFSFIQFDLVLIKSDFTVSEVTQDEKIMHIYVQALTKLGTVLSFKMFNMFADWYPLLTHA
jgi:hypothetical protein